MTSGGLAESARADASISIEPGSDAVRGLAHLMPGLWRALRRATPSFRDMPVIEAQVSILRRLHEMGPMTPAALADELRFARSTISKLSQGLLEDEIIERRPSDIDGRSFFLAPTTKGHDILETFRHDREQVLSIALRQLSPADIKRISRAMPSLEKLETVLNRDADEAEANRP